MTDDEVASHDFSTTDNKINGDDAITGVLPDFEDYTHTYTNLLASFNFDEEMYWSGNMVENDDDYAPLILTWTNVADVVGANHYI